MTLLRRAWCRLTAHRWRRLRKHEADEQIKAMRIYNAPDGAPNDFERRIRICSRCGATRLAAKRSKA